MAELVHKKGANQFFSGHLDIPSDFLDWKGVQDVYIKMHDYSNECIHLSFVPPNEYNLVFLQHTQSMSRNGSNLVPISNKHHLETWPLPDPYTSFSKNQSSGGKLLFSEKVWTWPGNQVVPSSYSRPCKWVFDWGRHRRRLLGKFPFTRTYSGGDHISTKSFSLGNASFLICTTEPWPTGKHTIHIRNFGWHEMTLDRDILFPCQTWPNKGDHILFIAFDMERSLLCQSSSCQMSNCNCQISCHVDAGCHPGESVSMSRCMKKIGLRCTPLNECGMSHLPKRRVWKITFVLGLVIRAMDVPSYFLGGEFLSTHSQMEPVIITLPNKYHSSTKHPFQTKKIWNYLLANDWVTTTSCAKALSNQNSQFFLLGLSLVISCASATAPPARENCPCGRLHVFPV